MVSSALMGIGLGAVFVACIMAAGRSLVADMETRARSYHNDMQVAAMV